MANNIYTFQKTVTTSGTPVQLTSQSIDPDQPVTIKAKLSNTGGITVGNTSANALNSGSGFYRLRPGKELLIRAADASKIWIDAQVSGDGVEVIVGGEPGSAYEVVLGSTIAGEDITNNVLKVEERFSYVNIAAATTTLVKTGAGFLHSITVNSTAAGTITIYDNTAASGTKIATLKASVTENTYFFDAAFTTGLTIVTAAASDITVSYR